MFSQFHSIAAERLRRGRPLLVAVLVLGWVMPAAAEPSLAEAVANLNAEDFRVREDAEAVLRGLKPEEEATLVELTGSSDPEVAFRARRALMYVRLGMNGGFPEDLARQIASLPEQSRRESSATMARVLGLHPLPLLTVAGLHTELLNGAYKYNRVEPMQLSALSEAIIATAANRNQPVEMAKLRPEIYHNETLACLVTGYARLSANNFGAILPTYAKWVEKRPALVAMLNGPAVQLEMARITSLGKDPAQQIPRLLTLARNFPNPSEQRKVVLARMVQLLRATSDFPLESLDRDQGYTLFAALEENWDPQMDVSGYKKFRQRFPGPHPTPEASTLEAIYTLDTEGVNAALAMALRQPKDHAAVWLGTYLQSHPEAIPNPFVIPEVKKGQRRHAHLAPFLNALVPLRSLPEMEANPKAMATFEALLRDENWLEAALQANVARLVFFQWIRQETLDTGVAKHLKEDTDLLRALGRLLVTKPESMGLINPANQKPISLQRILLGMLEVTPVPRPAADTVFQYAEEWQRVHPELWKTDAFRYELAKAESLAPNRTAGLHALIKAAANYPSDSPMFALANRSMRRYPEEALTFPTEKLNQQEGILFFRTFGIGNDAKRNFASAYLKFRKRFPEPLPEPEAMPLEAIAMLDAKQPNKAFGLALLQDATFAAQWTGEWINEHPDGLDKPLTLPNLGNHPSEHCDALLGAIAPYQTLDEARARPAQMKAIQTLLDTPEWLDAAVRGKNPKIVAFYFLLKNQLDDLLAKRVSGRAEFLTELGAILADHPEALATINPANQKPDDLKPLAQGIKRAGKNSIPPAVQKTLEKWEATHPGSTTAPAEPQPDPRNRGRGQMQFQMQLQIEEGW